MASCWVPPPRAGRLDASHKSPPRTPPFPDHPAKAPPSPQTAPCSPPLATRDETWSTLGPPENPPPPPWTTLQKTPAALTLKLLPPTVVHHHLVQISGRDYWNAGGRHDEIWEILGLINIAQLRLPCPTDPHPAPRISKGLDAEGGVMSRPIPWTPAHRPATPQFPKTPDAPPNFCPCPVPILVSPNATPANSDASLANSNSPLANFDALPAATDTYPGSPDP
ncbi:hypothetical protein E4T56_gene2821 [Termitomyces sp. T112]|nr:hypothetical protein E4T56_gene2821 [Termitomyces sp. T112]